MCNFAWEAWLIRFELEQEWELVKHQGFFNINDVERKL